MAIIPAAIIDERTPSNAPSCRMNYNRTKYLAEQEVIKAIGRGLGAVILNPCNIVGPYDPGKLVAAHQKRLSRPASGVPPGTGTFAHVRDIAARPYRRRRERPAGRKLYSRRRQGEFRRSYPGDHEDYREKPVLKKISKTALRRRMYASTFTSLFTGREPLLTLPKYMRMVGTLSCDCTKAITELGFSTGTLREMLTDCYRWLEQEGLL